MAKNRERIGRAFVAMILVAGLTVAAIAWDSYLDPFDDQPFDRATWSEADEQRRGPMARDAMRRLPVGLPAVQVKELLGQGEIIPARASPWSQEPLLTETWEYWLGSWSALHWYGFDSASLYVGFGSDGRVLGTRITGR